MGWITSSAGGGPLLAPLWEGFKLLFMGAMQGVLNPKAHDLFDQLAEDRALDYLAFASLLMRRLDDAEERLPASPDATPPATSVTTHE